MDNDLQMLLELLRKGSGPQPPSMSPLGPPPPPNQHDLQMPTAPIGLTPSPSPVPTIMEQYKADNQAPPSTPAPPVAPPQREQIDTRDLMNSFYGQSAPKAPGLTPDKPIGPGGQSQGTRLSPEQMQSVMGRGSSIGGMPGETKPWERSQSQREESGIARVGAQEDARAAKEQELRRAKGWRDINEGLGGFRKYGSLTAGGVLLGNEGGQVVDEDSRKDIANLEYELSPENDPNSQESVAAREMVKQAFGMDIDPTVPASQIQQFLPAITQGLRNSNSQAAAQQRIDFDKEKFQYGKENDQAKATESRERFDLSREDMERRHRETMSGRRRAAASQLLKDAASIHTQIRKMGDLEKMLNDPEVKKHLGPIAGRVTGWMDQIGISNSKTKEFIARMRHVQNEYIRAMTGAQLSEHEATRLMSALPQIHDNFGAFQAAFRVAIDKMRTGITDLNQVLVESGLNPANPEYLKQAGISTQPRGVPVMGTDIETTIAPDAANPTGDDTIQMKTPEGQIVPVHISKVEAAKKAGAVEVTR